MRFQSTKVNDREDGDQPYRDIPEIGADEAHRKDAKARSRRSDYLELSHSI